MKDIFHTLHELHKDAVERRMFELACVYYASATKLGNEILDERRRREQQS